MRLLRVACRPLGHRQEPALSLCLCEGERATGREAQVTWAAPDALWKPPRPKQGLLGSWRGKHGSFCLKSANAQRQCAHSGCICAHRGHCHVLHRLSSQFFPQKHTHTLVKHRRQTATAISCLLHVRPDTRSENLSDSPKI